MSCELAFCPMPHTAPPAKPAPASATSFRQSAGTSFTLGALCMSTNWTSRYSMASVCNCVASAVRVTVSPYSSARGFLGYVALSVYNRPVVTTQAGNAMCGIVGYLDKRARQDSPVGKVVLCMLDALSCRGPDSAGVAIFCEPRANWILQLKLPEHAREDEAPHIALEILRDQGAQGQGRLVGAYLHLEFEAPSGTPELERILV